MGTPLANITVSSLKISTRFPPLSSSVHRNIFNVSCSMRSEIEYRAPGRKSNMIIALLFTILFAVLFPGALRLLFAMMFITSLFVMVENVRAEPNWISLWQSVNEICRSGGEDSDRACNQITVLTHMMKDAGCKFHTHKWACPK
jgi:hypothetical protein